MLENQITVIHPRKVNGLWVFTDDRVGLVDELFVSGTDKILDSITREIPGAHDGFNLVFSSAWFPDYEHQFLRQYTEGGGVWYKHTRTAQLGWLCPALYLYFNKPPEILYIKAEPKR